MSDNFPLEAIQGMINRLEDKFDDRFNRVEERLEKLDDKVETVSKTTDKNSVVLEEHQRRALANERHAHLLEQQIAAEKAAAATALKASEDKQEAKVKELAETVEPFVKFPQYLYKFAVWVAAIVAGCSALYAVWHFFLAASHVIK